MEIVTKDRVVQNLNISASLDLNGHQLIVKGNVTHTCGTISFNQGSLSCEGDYTMKGNSSLSMKAQEDSLLIEGTFTSNYSKNQRIFMSETI